MEEIMELRRLLAAAYTGNRKGAVREEELLPLLGRKMTLRRVPEGTYLVRAGERAKALLLVASGEFYLVRTSGAGLTSMSGRDRAPEFIGLMQIFSGDPVYYADIVAARACLVVEIEREYLKECVQADGALGTLFIEDLVKVIRENFERMDRLAFHSAEENLIVYLIGKWRACGGGEEPLRVREKRAVIADDLSVSVRTVHRAVHALREQGLLSVGEDGELLLSPEQLRRLQGRFKQIN